MNQIASINQEAHEPHSVEAEQQLLGALLLGQSTAEVQAVGGKDIFYDPVHAGIYSICRNLEVNDKTVTPITVAAMLTPDLSAALSSLGGKGYLVTLAGASITPSLIKDYAGVIAEAKSKRRVIEIMRNAQQGLSGGEMTASDVAAQMEVCLQALEPTETRAKPVSMTKAVTDAMQEIYAAYSGEERRAVYSGIGALDKFVPGFSPGEMWLIGGRPSMGKTAVALSMGLNAARAGHPVIIVSLEMTPQAMAMRALSEGTSREHAATNYTNLRRGDFTEKQGEALKRAAIEVANLPITFLPREFQDTDLLQVGVKQVLRRSKAEKLPLVIVDYAQLLKSKARSRVEQITDVSIALKSMAMSLECPVIPLSQLSRAVEQREDKRPMLSDLRESGQLEQDADGVIFCFREQYYLEREEPDVGDCEAHQAWRDAMSAQRNKLELIVAKQRQGAIGTAHVRFNPALNLIWEGY